MNHSYLFEPATWHVSGHYIGESGQVITAQGQSVITHHRDIWVIQGLMRLRTEGMAEIGNMYQVIPFKLGVDHTSWSSTNDALGRIEGRFVIVDDTLISMFQTVNGKYKGAEFLRQVSHHQYLSKGVLLKGQIKLSSWSVELDRKD
jgi:hypothetical protein